MAFRVSPVACAICACFFATAGASAAIVITEVHPGGSGNVAYAADFFELTNTGAAAVDITGWKMDDSSNAFGTAVALRGITSIPAGASVVFFEGTATGTTDATITANFLAAWFGSSVPSGFLIGAYGGSGVGLSSTSDAVNIFDSVGTPITGVTFAASTLGFTFDNAAGGPGAISTLSVAGINGAFTSPNGEVGSPGFVPAPGVLGALGLGVLASGGRRRRTSTC